MARRTFFRLVTGAVLLVSWSCGPQNDPIIPNLFGQLDRYPDMAVEDIYKFVHQAAFGNTHILEHDLDAKGNLMQEWESLDSTTSESLFEDLSPDGKVVRLNLRPYKAEGGDPEKVWSAMERSAAGGYEGQLAFDRWWNEIVEESAFGTVPIIPDDLKEYYDARQKEGFPPVHHSDEYKRLYQPSYRVLLKEEAERLGLK